MQVWFFFIQTIKLVYNQQREILHGSQFNLASSQRGLGKGLNSIMINVYGGTVEPLLAATLSIADTHLGPDCAIQNST